jgi:hypothetical protein
MNTPLVMTTTVQFKREGHGGRRKLDADAPPPGPPRTPGRVPRVARLMALALRFEQQIRAGAITNYAELADLGHVSRARISQIMNLLNLAPDLQEALLFLPRTEHGRDPLHLCLLQPIASTLEWRKQRTMWNRLKQLVGLK